MPYLSSEAKEGRRRQFVEAARRCASRVGYRNLTVDEVCSEAGASKGSFYVHFATKEELLAALLDDDAAVMERVLSSSNVNGVPGLRRYLGAAIRQAQDPTAIQMRVDTWAEVLIAPALRERFVEALAERRRLLAKGIEAAVESGECRDVPANATASIVLALADGLTLHHALDPSGFRWANVRRALDAFLAGLDPGSE